MKKNGFFTKTQHDRFEVRKGKPYSFLLFVQIIKCSNNYTTTDIRIYSYIDAHKERNTHTHTLVWSSKHALFVY